jgi:S-formylglutathione hydrolase FrmB
MGGFGSLDVARHHPGRFCAVGAHSPALWRTGGETAAGAFDDAQDFARNDLVALAARRPSPWGTKTHLWLDAGTADPFDPGDRAFVAALRGADTPVVVHRWPGGHVKPYWRAHYADYLRFYARAFARCAA